MKNHYIDLDKVRNKNYYLNMDKRGHECYNACILCGKDLDGARAFVHMTVDGKLTDLSVNEIGETDSQGYFEIGSSCARKLPKSFVTVLDPIND